MSKRGLSTSFGGGPFRVSLGADCRIRRTIRIPGTGIYDVRQDGWRIGPEGEARTTGYDGSYSASDTDR